MAATIRVSINVKFGAISRQAHSRAALAVKKAAFDIEAHAKANAPVDTGFLEATITADRYSRGNKSAHPLLFKAADPLTWTVTAYAGYAAYVEYGTRFMPAQPFMSPAADLVRPSLQAALRQLI